MKFLRLIDRDDDQILEVNHCEFGGVYMEIRTDGSPICENIVLSEDDIQELIKFLKDE